MLACRFVAMDKRNAGLWKKEILAAGVFARTEKNNVLNLINDPAANDGQDQRFSMQANRLPDCILWLKRYAASGMYQHMIISE